MGVSIAKNQYTRTSVTWTKVAVRAGMAEIAVR